MSVTSDPSVEDGGDPSVSLDVSPSERVLALEERLKLALEATGLGSWELAADTGVITPDLRSTLIFGLPPGLPLDFKTFLNFVHPEDRDQVASLVQTAFSPSSGGDYRTEYRIIRGGDRAERGIAARGRVFFDQSKRPIRMVGTVLDITEQKRQEEETNRRAEFLRLLLGIVSHDLRNPMGAILLSAELLLQQGELSRQQTEVLKRIHHSGKRATGLISRLMDFTQASLGGGIPIHPVLMNARRRPRWEAKQRAHPSSASSRRPGAGLGRSPTPQSPPGFGGNRRRPRDRAPTPGRQRGSKAQKPPEK